MAAFLALTYLESQLPDLYVWLYITKVCVVAGLLFAFRSTLRDIVAEGRVILPAVLVGLAVFAEWVWIDKLIPYPHLGARTGYNPFTAIADPAVRSLFLAFRFLGLVALVPVMEELFWRSFLLRFVTDQDWERVPIGTFTWGAFAIVAGLFGLAHPEWLVAVIAAAAYGLLLWRTKSVFACVIAHAVTNLALGVYVIATKDWVYW
jgi:hypothetical protein